MFFYIFSSNATFLSSRAVTVLPSTGGAAAAAAASSAEPGPSMPAYYLVKWITWKEKKTPIITQSENGPCPLLGIMNTLFLRWKVKLAAISSSSFGRLSSVLNVSCLCSG